MPIFALDEARFRLIIWVQLEMHCTSNCLVKIPGLVADIRHKSTHAERPAASVQSEAAIRLAEVVRPRPFWRDWEQCYSSKTISLWLP